MSTKSTSAAFSELSCNPSERFPSSIWKIPTESGFPMDLTQLTVTEVSPAYWRISFSNPPTNLQDPRHDPRVPRAGHPDGIRRCPESRRNRKRQPRTSSSTTTTSPGQPKPRSRPGQRGFLPGSTPPRAWRPFRWSPSPRSAVATEASGVRGGKTAFDLRFASIEKAVFGQPEVGAGMFPGGGALSSDCHCSSGEAERWKSSSEATISMPRPQRFTGGSTERSTALDWMTSSTTSSTHCPRFRQASACRGEAPRQPSNCSSARRSVETQGVPGGLRLAEPAGAQLRCFGSGLGKSDQILELRFGHYLADPPRRVTLHTIKPRFAWARAEARHTVITVSPEIPDHSLELRSLVTDQGTLEPLLGRRHPARPVAAGQVLVRMEAAPINPSDLGLLFASAPTAAQPLSAGTTERPVVTVQLSGGALRALAASSGTVAARRQRRERAPSLPCRALF